MDKFRRAAAAVADKLRLTTAALAIQRSIAKHQGRIVKKAHDQASVAAQQADKLRRQGKPKKAHRQDVRALKQHRTAEAARLRVQAAVGEIKRLSHRKRDLDAEAARIKAELDKLDKVKIEGNHATGGTKRQRLKAVALAAAAACASGRRHNFYSQSGTWDVDHAITGEPYGHRSDCSSWVTSVYRACGLPDPNGNQYRGGYTGTLGAHGKRISRGELQPGDLILYGPFPHHHVEMFIGTPPTIGHGSAPVDAGVIDLIPGEKTYRSYVK